MALQDVTINITDGALGLQATDPSNTILVLGVSSGGTPNTLYPVTSADQITTLGFGPGVEAVKHAVDEGALVYFMPVTQGTAGSNSAVAQPGGSPPAVGLSGTPYDTYQGRVKITLGGTLGTAKFQYSLDDGETWSPDILTAATYPVPNSGITITFAAGTYVLNDVYTWTSTAPYYNTTNLGAAFDAALLDPREWGLVYVVGTPAGATEADKATALAAVIASVATKMTAAASAYRFARAVVEAADFADSGAALIAAAPAIAQTRVACVAGFAKILSPLTGRRHNVNIARATVSKLGRKPVGKDPSQVLAENGTGPLPSAVLSLKHDERKAPGLDAARFVTARTYIGKTGFYVTNFNLLSAPGSDFKYLQHGQIIDVGSRVLRNKLLDYLSRDLEVNANGTLSEPQAQAIDEDCDGAVRAALVQPGHANNIVVTTNRTDDVLSTERLRVKLRVQPKFYPKTIEVEIGFTKTIPATT